MNSATHQDPSPEIHKVPVIAIASLIIVSIALTMSVSFGFFERQAIPDEVRAADGVKAVDQRTVKFFDTADGGVWVEDGETGEELARFGINEGGFVRSTARALIHGRNVRGIGPEVPFDLVSYDNGSMTLRDSVTGQAVELASFGKATNEVYVDILKKGRQ